MTEEADDAWSSSFTLFKYLKKFYLLVLCSTVWYFDQGMILNKYILVDIIAIAKVKITFTSTTF